MDLNVEIKNLGKVAHARVSISIFMGFRLKT
ncbi:hypothetical protein NMEN2795_1260 [Neisseria meningitidis NM2795]|nr:hypothetical protein NMEN2795_1260 [Neisseria meningitidis NM2795]